ncbi:hypothetical protein Ddye_021396 [Dipteronia dyeriana]|uniref:Uncharacterized protein n=1 Tax=Dipteronia dyeriana TaxID=168575 RepID=A0AAD9WWU9_9ROSI|nr:hypothetical protein Ddye_021396 [Dipteronia dyeriana]
MKVSVNKIDEVMEFLLNKLGLEPSAIVKCPEVVGLSVEKNFVPRVAVIKFLRSNRLIKYGKNTDIDFLTIFQYPEEIFLEKFVNRYDEAPRSCSSAKQSRSSTERRWRKKS